jgi:TP901 family phage tail tape measure protein
MASNPKAEIQITAESRTLGAKLREAREKFAKFGGLLRKEVFGKALFDSQAGAHMVGQVGASAVGRGLGFFEDQARGVFEFNEALTNFQIAARKTPEEANEIGKAARQIAEEVGLGSEKVLAGEQAWVDLAGAENGTIESMRTLARVSRAGNTEIGYMATVMYSLSNAMNIKPAQMEDAISGLINQSKDGTIHFKNMAEEIIAVAPKFARFGVTGRQGVAELGAMFQIVRSGFKGAAETATGLEGIFKGIRQHADRFKHAGVDLVMVGKDGVRHLRPLQDIFAQIEKSKKLMGDPTGQKLMKAFGRGEGEAAFRLLVEQAEKFNDLVKAGLVNGTVAADLNTKNESSAGRLAIAYERIKNAVAEAFTPERIDAFVSAIEDLPDKVEGIAKGLGIISDALGALYNAGKAVRGFLTPDDSVLAEMSEKDIDREANNKGISKGEAVQNLQAQWGRYLKAKRSITEALNDGKTTPESNKRAVEALISPDDANGVGARKAAAQYLEAAHIPTSSELVLKLTKQIKEERIDADIEAGRGSSKLPTQQADMQAAFLKALTDGAPVIGRSIAQAISSVPPPPISVKADGKALVDIHGNSAAHSKRPKT